jgi:hypothetical protein
MKPANTRYASRTVRDPSTWAIESIHDCTDSRVILPQRHLPKGGHYLDAKVARDAGIGGRTNVASGLNGGGRKGAELPSTCPRVDPHRSGKLLFHH